MLKSLKARLFAFEDTLTVRMQIGVATAVLCVGIAIALAIGSALVSRARVERLISAEMASFSRSFAENLDLFMHGRYQEIQTLANLGIVREAWIDDPARIRGALEGMKGRLPDYTWIGFATPDGIVRVSTGRLLENVSVAGLPWFKKGLEKPITLDVHDASLLAAHVGPNAKGQQPRFVDIAAPVRDADGRVIGVLGAHVNWEWVEKLRDRLDARGGTQNIKLTILSSDGVVLLGDGIGQRIYPKERVDLIRAGASGALGGRNGSPMLTGYALANGHLDYPGLGWIVLAQKPAELALIAAQTTAAVILCIGAVLAAIGVGFASLIAGRIARPLQLLTAQADRIGRDASAQMLPRQRGCVEVLQLSAALRSLLRRLGVSEQMQREAESRATDTAEKLGRDLSAMRELADTDALTGMPNRRSFMAAAAAAMDYFRRYARPIGFLMIDIDNFKQVNDRFGHAAGDAVICAVGQHIQSAIRASDKAARFGGEEFVVLLREAEEIASGQLAERIRSSVETNPVFCANAPIHVTVSIGCAIAVQADSDAEAVMERADTALYKAKNAGRNRVVLVATLERRAEKRVA